MLWEARRRLPIQRGRDIQERSLPARRVVGEARGSPGYLDEEVPARLSSAGRLLPAGSSSSSRVCEGRSGGGLGGSAGLPEVKRFVGEAWSEARALEAAGRSAAGESEPSRDGRGDGAGAPALAAAW